MTPAPHPFLPHLAAETLGKGAVEAIGLWESGWRIWAEYVADLTSAFTPEAVLQANCKLFANWVAAPGLAAGEVQRETGLTTPTLNA
ncbi:hypothetical protein ACFODL_07500 [Phenylobacterium terrae]|uniref:Transcriptional regulator n=1 Tax=Phenylobacterium terrae TaxID=2665495 RepID=A0ABW4N420_9CAUL